MSDKHLIQEFTPINGTTWQHIKDNMKAKTGIEIVGNAGEVTGESPLGKITVKYAYDASAQMVTIQTLHHPFLISEATVDQKIHNEIEGAMEGTE